ncbi:hypothetical protein ACOBQB_08020 [Streptomyces sp. G5(2025)]|uniref:hypothetical protein n=1 Tax=Streptomyces sp. G5(2025) TaxID=3406628 RepID=UPI003C166DEA
MPTPECHRGTGRLGLAARPAPPDRPAPPGTRRVERLEENARATQVALSADDIADLDATVARIGVHGDRYNDVHMGLVGK